VENPSRPGTQIGQLNDDEIDFDLPTKRVRNASAKPVAPRGQQAQNAKGSRSQGGNVSRILVVRSR
jgi:hypothetical protein